MYTNQGELLKTYGSVCFEEHEDSTDFEGQIVSSSKGNPRLLNRQSQEPPRRIGIGTNYQYNNMYEDYDKYPVKLRKVNHKFSGTDIGPQRVKIKGKMQKKRNKGDQISISTYKVQSKMSLIKHKLYPCISSLFKRPNRKEETENPIKNTMNKCCQHCDDCEWRRIKKLYKKREQFTPVYASEGKHRTQVPFEQTRITEKASKSRDRKKFATKSSVCSMSSSSESEILSLKERHQNLHHLRRTFKSELLKERLNYQNQHFRNQHVQFPPKYFKFSPYQVFSSSYHQAVNSRVSHDLDIKYLSDMPSSSSGFLDYLFDKFNRKYTTQRLELPRHCECNVTQIACTPDNCGFIDRKTTESKDPTPDKSKMISTQIPNLEVTVDSSSQTEDDYKTTSPSDNNRESISIESDELKSESKSCQKNHDALISALAEKYKGEILCIHNPPCVLINGCLQLPPLNREPKSDVWVTQTKKSGFCEGFRRKKLKAKWEQGYQYHIPFIDVQQCQIPAYKSEKTIQSACYHSPPCEVVRGCLRAKYDPNLHTSCIDVPMCTKIPQCTVGQPEATCCQHKPKCQSIPLCSKARRSAVLTARETVATQAKPAIMVCRHVPPCVMIPRCLGQAMIGTCVGPDAIPGCGHRPPCDNIPACCRRKATSEMVHHRSASSQYPNSCRVV